MRKPSVNCSPEGATFPVLNFCKNNVYGPLVIITPSLYFIPTSFNYNLTFFTDGK